MNVRQRRNKKKKRKKFVVMFLINKPFVKVILDLFELVNVDKF